MKIILLKQKKGLGKIGEVVTVKDGFGRNYLLPQKIAVRATKENESKIENMKLDLEKRNQEAKKNAEMIAEKISDKDFTFIKQCADDGRLFGSVSSKEIAKIMETSIGSEFQYNNVLLGQPIKTLGVYNIAISLHADVSCNILINVARSQSEAQDAINEYRLSISKDPESKDEAAA